MENAYFKVLAPTVPAIDLLAQLCLRSHARSCLFSSVERPGVRNVVHTVCSSWQTVCIEKVSMRRFSVCSAKHLHHLPVDYYANALCVPVDPVEKATLAEKRQKHQRKTARQNGC